MAAVGRKEGAGDLILTRNKEENQGELNGRKVATWKTPLLIVLIILALIGLGVAGPGFAGLGASQSWWTAGALGNLGLTNSIIMLTASGAWEVVLTIIGIAAYMIAKPKKDTDTGSGVKGNPLGEKFEDVKIDEATLEIAFGFRVVKNFTCKQRDGYLIASNNAYNSESEFNMAIRSLEDFFKGKKRNEAEITADEIKVKQKYIDLAAQEYKIHLMPKAEHMEEVVGLLTDKLARDVELQQHVAQYKVMLGEKTDTGVRMPIRVDEAGHFYPRIVLYAQSKEAGQAILNAVIELYLSGVIFGDGDNYPPRSSQRVNPLVFYAHGSGDIKNLADKCNFKLFEDSEEYKLEIPTP